MAGLVWLEFRALTWSGPRARLALAAALAVGIAILLALLLRLQAVYWAGISAFVCVQASHPQSLRKGVHRIIGTLLGAAAAYLLFPLVAYDPFGTLLLLFAAGTLAILGSLVSDYSYAWLLGGITVMMVVLGALNDPSKTLDLAFYRSSEIILGTATALATARILLPRAEFVPRPAPGWASLRGEHAYMLGHAMRSGIGMALVPVIWRVFELPDLSQMAVSIGAVMAVPVLTGDAVKDRQVLVDRALQRLLGCVIGGGAGLLLLLTPLAQSFPIWLLALMAGAAIAAEFETGRYNLQNLGIQAEIGLIITMVQGWGPAVQLAPAFDRVAGMIGAMLLLMAVHFFLDQYGFRLNRKIQPKPMKLIAKI